MRKIVKVYFATLIYVFLWSLLEFWLQGSVSDGMIDCIAMPIYPIIIVLTLRERRHT